MADEEVDAVTEGSDGEVAGGREEVGEVNEAGSEHEDSGIVAAEPADAADADGTGEGKSKETAVLQTEDGGDGVEKEDVAEEDVAEEDANEDQEQNVVLTPPKFGDFLLKNSMSGKSDETASDEESQGNGLVFEGDEPADESDSSAAPDSKVTEITADDEDKDSNGVEHVASSKGKSGDKSRENDTADVEKEDGGGEVGEVTGDGDSVVVSQGDSTEAPQESQEEEDDKEVEDIMANCESNNKAEDSDSDIEMVEEIKKNDDDDDDDIQEVIDDDEEGATAATAPRAPRRKTQEQEVVELSSDDESLQPNSGDASEEEPEGDPNREPGADATKTIDPAHLVPFRFGWRREVVMRRVGGGSITSTQSDVYYIPPENGKYRTREARRKRRSKADQEKYFEDFPTEDLSIVNFTYVRRPLELNNAAYEIVRKGATRESNGKKKSGKSSSSTSTRSSMMSSSTSSGKAGVKYREVEESHGLLESDEELESDEKIDFTEGFDLCTPLTLQVRKSLVGLRSEHKKRRKYRDPETCCTPPLAEDMLWSRVDEDPLGVYNDLGGRSSPSTPPPLRAVKLTRAATVERIAEAFQAVYDEAAKVSMTKEQEMKESMPSHDAAITRWKDFVYTPKLQKKAYDEFNRSATHFSRASLMKNGGVADQTVKVKLPMQSVNGKRPVVELVIEQGGRYQPIKFSNNMQVTESIPKSIFDKANRLRKTCYLKATQVPRVGGKQLMLAVNPSAAAAQRLNAMSLAQTKAHHNSLAAALPKFNSSQAQQRSPASSFLSNRPRLQPMQRPQQSQPPPAGDQVSILVKPAKAAANQKPVLLNVPRKVALKVKVGTTLSFSASSDQKYTVIDNKIHPPVKTNSGGGGGGGKSNNPKSRPMSAGSSQGFGFNRRGQQYQPISPRTHSLQASLPRGVSIRALGRSPGQFSASATLAAQQQKRQRQHHNIVPQTASPVSPKVLSSGEVLEHSARGSSVTPCTPYCPGVSGFPELECNGCQSLFHSKCAGIAPNRVAMIKRSFRCKSCASSQKSKAPFSRPLNSNGPPQVIDLD